MALVAIAAFALMGLPDRSWLGSLVLRDAVWVVGLLAATKAGLATNRAFPGWAFGKFVLWGVAFGVIHFAMHAILVVANSASLDLQLAWFASLVGALIGAGIGLGVEAADLMRSRAWLVMSEATEGGS